MPAAVNVLKLETLEEYVLVSSKAMSYLNTPDGTGYLKYGPVLFLSSFYRFFYVVLACVLIRGVI